jgi:hypothetical protein
VLDMGGWMCVRERVCVSNVGVLNVCVCVLSACVELTELEIALVDSTSAISKYE